MIDTEDEPPKPDPRILRKLIEAPFPVSPEGPGDCCPTEDGPQYEDIDVEGNEE